MHVVLSIGDPGGGQGGPGGGQGGPGGGQGGPGGGQGGPGGGQGGPGGGQGGPGGGQGGPGGGQGGPGGGQGGPGGGQGGPGGGQGGPGGGQGGPGGGQGGPGGGQGGPGGGQGGPGGGQGGPGGGQGGPGGGQGGPGGGQGGPGGGQGGPGGGQGGPGGGQGGPGGGQGGPGGGQGGPGGGQGGPGGGQGGPGGGQGGPGGGQGGPGGGQGGPGGGQGGPGGGQGGPGGGQGGPGGGQGGPGGGQGGPGGGQGGEAPAPHSDLIPVEKLARFAYCRRLGYLEYAQGEFAHNEYTADGSYKHRNVDKPAGGRKMADALEAGDKGGDDAGAGGGSGAGGGGTVRAHSVMLSDEGLGLVGKLDLVEMEGSLAVPVEYKRRAVPDTPERTHLEHRVQVCAQALLLRANGYECTRGAVYYMGSKQRIAVAIDAQLEAETLRLLDDFRRTASSGSIPAPLEDSPKCPPCSLVGICLPDEVNLLGPDPKITRDQVRRMYPLRDDAVPLYVQEQGARVTKSGECLVVKRLDAKPQTIRLIEVSDVAVYGNVQVTTQAIREMCDRGIPVCFMTYGGWFTGMVTPMTGRNVDLRAAQHAKFADAGGSMAIARQIVHGKLRNSATMLRRNGGDGDGVRRAVEQIDELAGRALSERRYEALLGIEGLAARAYFGQFRSMVKGTWAEFDFEGRNKRPPRDIVNAMLSYLYSLLARDAAIAASGVGLDPHVGFLHRPKHGKPALALDIMEEFRPLVADSVCIRCINGGEVGPSDAVRTGVGVNLTASGRRAVTSAYSRRMDSQVTHPLLGYAASYRRVLATQARLLSRHLTGEIPAYPAFRTR